MNSQKQLNAFLKERPGSTEREICFYLWKSTRDKKHADLIRRALEKGVITRFKGDLKYRKNIFVYYSTEHLIEMRRGSIFY